MGLTIACLGIPIVIKLEHIVSGFNLSINVL